MEAFAADECRVELRDRDRRRRLGRRDSQLAGQSCDEVGEITETELDDWDSI